MITLCHCRATQWLSIGNDMTCCFFGHKDTPSTIKPALEEAIADLIENQNCDSFLVGHQGSFDGIVLGVLRNLKQKYPNISYNVVLAYMPGEKTEYEFYAPEETMYPEGLESVHPRFAISWRNKWLVNECDFVICYINRSWGGAAQYVELAQKKNKSVINLASRSL